MTVPQSLMTEVHDADLYETRVRKFAARQWTTDNAPDVKDFLRRYLGTGVRFPRGVQRQDGMLEFHAWNDTQVLEPGDWVVIYFEPAGHGDLFRDQDFQRLARKSGHAPAQLAHAA